MEVLEERFLPAGIPIQREVWDYSRNLAGDLDHFDQPTNYTFGRSEGSASRGTNPILGGDDVDAVYELLGSIHQFLFNTLGRDGANGQGGTGDGVSTPLNRTRAEVYRDRPLLSCPNAIASVEEGLIRICPSTAVPDIVAHEYAHLLSDSAGFSRGSGEAGALSESFSDLFAEVFEFSSQGTNDWRIGEGLSKDFWRNLSDPVHSGSPFPDYTQSPNVVCPSPTAFTADYVNASIPNKAGYLVAMGGDFRGFSIQGIGRNEMLRVWYDALDRFFTQNESFHDAYWHLLASARELYGPVVAAEVDKALRAVGMDRANVCTGVPDLTLVPEQTSIVEGGDSVVVAIHRSGDDSQPVTVELTETSGQSDFQVAGSLASNITIPGGTRTAEFRVRVPGRIVSPTTLTITATAANHTSGSARIAALDGEVIDVRATILALPDTPTRSSFLVTSTSAGRLDAWIDFNQDGDWSDPGEQVVNAVDIALGQSGVGFEVPAGALSGATTAKFQIRSPDNSIGADSTSTSTERTQPVILLNGDLPEGASVEVKAPFLGVLEVRAESENVVVHDGTTELFRAPQSSIQQLDILNESDRRLNLSNRWLRNLFAGDRWRFKHDESLGVGNYASSVIAPPQIDDDGFHHVVMFGTTQMDVFNSTPFHNPLLAMDVNRDGLVTPIDALIVVNFLNALGSQLLAKPENAEDLVDFRYFDTNQDRFASALDVLLVINFLNATAESSPVG